MTKQLLIAILCMIATSNAVAQYTVNIGDDFKLYAPASTDSRHPDLYDVRWSQSGTGSVTFITTTSNPTTVRGVSAGSVRVLCQARYYNKTKYNDPLYSGYTSKSEYYTVTVVDPNAGGGGGGTGGGYDPDPDDDDDDDLDIGDYFMDYTIEGHAMLFGLSMINGEYCAEVVPWPKGYSTVTLTEGDNGKVTIPEKAKGYPVRVVCNAAFKNSKYLTELSIPSSVNRIENYAVLNCENLKVITSLNETPPLPRFTSTYMFFSDPWSIILYVPTEAAKEAYMNATGWQYFKEYRVLEEEKVQLQLSASPPGGEVTAGTKVYLSTTNATGADIYYTLNGSTPSNNSTKYTSAGITISSDCTLKAIAYKGGYTDSNVLTVSYTVKKETYYYVGNINNWDITDRTYPFTKASDGVTWELTISADATDEFLVVPSSTTSWDGTTYGTNSSSNKGSLVANEGHNNFVVPYWAGMHSYTVSLNMETMTYEITRKRTTYSGSCERVIAQGKDDYTYRVIGVVGEITNRVYGNWYLKDDTGQLYIYGTRDKDGHTGQNNSIAVWNIETGDSIIVVGKRYTYNGTVELIDVGVEKVTKKNPFIIENGLMQVTPQDSLQLAVAYAPSNTTIKLSAGNYYISYPTLDYYSGLSIQKNLTIEGEGMGVTTIHGRFDMQNGAGLTLKNLTLDGENTNQTQPIIYRDDVAYSDLVILDCEIKSYQKGFLYVNVASEINNITINNCLIHDIEGLQDFFDCRQGYYANFVLMNSTIYNCCTNGRDLFRLDDSSSSFANPRSPQITVKQCTFYQVGNSGDTRLFYVRFAGNKISFTDNVIALFSGSRGFANVSKTDPTPTLSNNFYYKTENLCFLSSNGDESIKWFDASGTILNPNDQLFQDVENHNYRVLSQAVIKSKAGDPRWLKDTSPSTVISISSAGYATFYSSKSAYALPNGLSAQVVTGASNGKLSYKTIADGSVSGVLPKGTAVMLVSDDLQSGSYTLTPSDATTAYSGTNLLHGSDEATTTSGSGRHYKLSYGPSSNWQWKDVFGWYWGAQSGGPFQIEGHKAWLVLPQGTRAAGFSVEGEVLGIDEEDAVEVHHAGQPSVFDLQGRRVATPTKRGMYILRPSDGHSQSKKIIINK